MNQISTVSHEDENNDSELVMNIVIKSIRGIYPSFRYNIKTQQELDNLKREWLIAFIENGIRSDVQINRGLKRARMDQGSFIPSVGQFVEWCKAPDRSLIAFDTKSLGHERNKLSSEEVKDLLNKNNTRNSNV